MEPQYKTDQLRAALVEADTMEGPESTCSSPLYPEQGGFWINPCLQNSRILYWRRQQKARGLHSTAFWKLASPQIVCHGVGPLTWLVKLLSFCFI